MLANSTLPVLSHQMRHVLGTNSEVPSKGLAHDTGCPGRQNISDFVVGELSGRVISSVLEGSTTVMLAVTRLTPGVVSRKVQAVRTAATINSSFVVRTRVAPLLCGTTAINARKIASDTALATNPTMHGGVRVGSMGSHPRSVHRIHVLAFGDTKGT